MTYILIVLVLLYVSLSLVEYLVHRVVMHMRIGGDTFKHHIQHHMNVLPDGTLKDEDFQGTRFCDVVSVSSIFAATVTVTILSVLCADRLHGRLAQSADYFYAAGCGVALASLYILTWNAIHPAMHEDPERFGEACWVSRWLLDNHMKHHHVKGAEKGNYNTILPLWDHILGTY